MSKKGIKKENKELETNSKDEKKGRGIMWVIFILVLCIFVYFSIKDALTYADSKKPVNVVEIDENIDDIGEEQTNADLEEKLRQAIEDSKLRVHINSNPVFSDSLSLGYLNIENNMPNKHPIMVEIRLENGDLIYSSKLIPVGKAVNNARLDVRLEKGNYPCVAYFHYIDENTGEVIGTAGASIVITVKS